MPLPTTTSMQVYGALTLFGAFLLMSVARWLYPALFSPSVVLVILSLAALITTLIIFKTPQAPHD